jgi:hypothetical protein
MALSSVSLRRVASIVAIGLLCGTGVSSPSDVKHAASPAQLALMHELRVCLDVGGAKEVPADVVLACLKKDVGVLVGISRDDLFAGLGKPQECRPDGGVSPWDFPICRGAVDVDYVFLRPCKVPGPAEVLGILFSSAGVVTRSDWRKYMLLTGVIRCIPPGGVPGEWPISPPSKQPAQ